MLRWSYPFPKNCFIAPRLLGPGVKSYPSTMAKYDGLLFAPEQYYEIGPFRFPVYKDLNPAEIKAVNKIEKQSAEIQLKTMDLARKIAKEENVTAKVAMNMLANASAPENEDIVYKYLDELQKLNDSAEDEIDKLSRYATTLMQFRGEVKLTADGEWQATTDWTAEDTSKIHRKLLEQMQQFILWERDGWPEDRPEGAVGNESAAQTPKAKTST